MKPRIFIGSSSERLDISYAIQENLDDDAEITVWTQDVFKLSKSILDSLIESLSKFDFAIFVFHPDDITQIRKEEFNTVRDNLIFELGLFMGKLGKEKVLFLVPKSIDNLRLPTDLLGITYGTYNNNRSDSNLRASLGPFCNQIRKDLENYELDNTRFIERKDHIINQLIKEKKDYWEFKLSALLMKSNLKDINETYVEIEEGLIFQRVRSIDGMEFFNWFRNSLGDFENFVNLFEISVNKLVESWGTPGESGDSIKIKKSITDINKLCKELINWEYELSSLIVPDKLKIVKNKLLGTTKKLIIDELNKLLEEIEDIYVNSSNNVSLTFTPTFPSELHTVTKDFEDFLYSQDI